MPANRPPPPSHASLTRHLATLLPYNQKDIPRLHHVPRHQSYNPEFAAVDRLVLSITPTPGVYALIGHPEPLNPCVQPPLRHRSPRTAVFLHRPFHLDRRRVRRGTLVLASHVAFDEVLTVGWNVALAARLGVDVRGSLCVRGYKGDGERRIGIVGRVENGVGVEEMMRRVRSEFGSVEMVRSAAADGEVRAVAIMNAFGETEVERVVGMVRGEGWVDCDDEAVGGHVLYLTGQPRVPGLEAAQRFGVAVACVGHRTAEEWGIRYLAAEMRTKFPGLYVEELYEEEEAVVRPKKEAVLITGEDFVD